MPGFDFSTFLAQGTILLLVFKFFFVVGALMYVLFAVVVIRQIVVMKNTLLTSFSPILQVVGYLHFALAIAVLLLFFVIL